MITSAFKEVHVCLGKHRLISGGLMSAPCVSEYSVSPAQRERVLCALLSIKVLPASPAVILEKLEIGVGEIYLQ